jgi:hypothetical protein
VTDYEAGAGIYRRVGEGNRVSAHLSDKMLDGIPGALGLCTLGADVGIDDHSPVSGNGSLNGSTDEVQVSHAGIGPCAESENGDRVTKSAHGHCRLGVGSRNQHPGTVEPSHGRAKTIFSGIERVIVGEIGHDDGRAVPDRANGAGGARWRPERVTVLVRRDAFRVGGRTLSDRSFYVEENDGGVAH